MSEKIKLMLGYGQEVIGQIELIDGVAPKTLVDATHKSILYSLGAAFEKNGRILSFNLVPNIAEPESNHEKKGHTKENV